MMLNELIGNIEVDFIKGNVKKDIVNIAYNSSTVGSDWCFVAVSGLKADGHDFIDDAVARGATAIVSEFKVDLPEHVASVVVKDTRIALARISANYFNNPSLGMRLVGVTGTNGKTTITYLLESILQKSKSEPGVIGTVNYRYGGGNWPAQHTTPESYELQKLLRRMADSEVTDVVMEVSSHAIDMERIVGCHFDGAIFTNLSTEHLDYHGDIESYFATKARLFEECLMVSEKKNVWAVINWDDPRGKALVGGVACPVFKYGLLENSDVYTKNIRSSMDGIEMDVVTPIGTFSCSSRLIGTFNAYNILAAVAAAVAMGVELSEIKEGIESVSNVPGRMEYIENNRGIYAFVDYAHTPDALENVLSSIQKIASKKIITVFGCGGDRDQSKRSLMGAAVSKISNITIVTSDNPRTEEPNLIIKEIIKGVVPIAKEFSPEDQSGYLIIPDRYEAINKALGLAEAGDVVLIAGKGHEDYQIVGTIRKKFDDREVVREILNRI